MNRAIADYALLADGASAALVHRSGSIDWWCPGRFDAESVFARLLDDRAGSWTLRPAEPCDVTREYVANTMVLQTDFTTATGTLRVLDALALPRAEPHELGRNVPRRLVRRAECVSGSVDVTVELVPRFDYGRESPSFAVRDTAVTIRAGKQRLRLHTDQPLRAARGGVTADLALRAGDVANFVLDTGDGEPRANTGALLADTIATWQAWANAHRFYDGVYADEVARSSLVLQALTYHDAGSILAAPTTSLPEILGGEANWDYRYAWLRDASIVIQALRIGACPDEAVRYFEWMAAAKGEDAEPLQIVYAVDGARDLSESVLPHLAGYAESRPVRIGNDAWRQRQLDVPGEIFDAAWQLRHDFDCGGRVGPFLTGVANLTVATWRDKDSGIWEGREGERNYVSSKLMCWVALDRAVKLAPALGEEPSQWACERDAVRDEILTRGWNEDVGAFTGAFDSDHLDASVLLLPIVGFLPASDPRCKSTIAVIERDLAEHDLVRRWTGAEPEGAFVMCSYWLAQCHALAGRVDRAREVFERVTGFANDLGLLSEMVDPATELLVGNFPQTLSHAALINAAATIQQAIDRGAQ